MPDNFAIKTDNLARSFGEVEAVKDLSIEIPKGEIYGFLGLNGAGKTTALRMMCSLLRPSGGSAVVAGHDVSKEPERVRIKIGAAMQGNSLDNFLTGREFLYLQGRFYKMTSKQIASRIQELAPLLEMDAIDRRIKSYSGGMKRRLDVAAAMMHNPEILFLDEPTTGLDPPSRSAVWKEIEGLNRNHGITVFLTTQYLEEADNLADRIGIIDDGVLAAEGSPEEMKHSIGDDIISVVFDEENPAAVEKLKGLAGVQSVDVHDTEIKISTPDGADHLSPVAIALRDFAVKQITLKTPSLDDVFLKVTNKRITDTDESETQEP